MARPMFIFGGDTGVSSPEELQRLRSIAEALSGPSRAPRDVGEGLNAIGQALLYRSVMGKANRMAEDGQAKGDAAFSPIAAALAGGGAFPAAPGAPAAGSDKVAKALSGSSVGGAAPDLSGNDIYSGFMDTVKGKVSNPNALAAIAATGKSESGFSPSNAFRSWSDPSQSGKAGTAGGIMSWRDDRLARMQQFAAANGGDPNKPSPQLQAQFFLQEDPNLIASLNATKSPEEAQRLMNNAWKFAGYDKPGGEAGRRLALANSFASQFQGDGGQHPVQVASLDPSAGMPAPQAAAQPAPGYRPGEPAYTSDKGQRVVQALMNPQSMTGGSPMPLQGAGALGQQPAPGAQAVPPMPAEYANIGVSPEDWQRMNAPNGDQIAAAPQPAPALPAPQTVQNQPVAVAPDQMAQASPMPEMAGNTADLRGQTGPSVEQLYQVLQNPWLSQQQRGMVGALLQQKMQEQDPAYKLGLEKSQLEVENLRNPRISPADQARLDMDRQKFGLDQKKYATDSSLAREKFDWEKDKDRLPEFYDAYVKQEEDAGRKPLGILEYVTTSKKAGAMSVTTNLGGEPSDGKLREALDKKTGEAWAGYSEAGSTSSAMAQDMQLLDELIKIAPQGPVTGRLAEMFPGVSSAGDAFQSIVKRVAPTLRAAGSGSTSDIEYDGMLRSLPALRNQPEANAVIAEIMKAKAALNIERADVIDAYGRGEISAGEARAQISEMNKRSIMTPEMKKAFGGLSGQSDPGDTNAPEGVDPSDWKFMTPEERRMWQ